MRKTFLGIKIFRKNWLGIYYFFFFFLGKMDQEIGTNEIKNFQDNFFGTPVKIICFTMCSVLKFRPHVNSSKGKKERRKQNGLFKKNILFWFKDKTILHFKIHNPFSP